MAGPCTRNAVGSNSGVGIGRGAEAAMSAVCAQAAAIGSSHVVGAGLRPALTKTYRKGSSYCICSVDLSPAPPLKRGLRLPCSVDGQWVHLSQRYRTPIDGMPRRGRPQGSPLQSGSVTRRSRQWVVCRRWDGGGGSCCARGCELTTCPRQGEFARRGGEATQALRRTQRVSGSAPLSWLPAEGAHSEARGCVCAHGVRASPIREIREIRGASASGAPNLAGWTSVL